MKMRVFFLLSAVIAMLFFTSCEAGVITINLTGIADGAEFDDVLTSPHPPVDHGVSIVTFEVNIDQADQLFTSDEILESSDLSWSSPQIFSGNDLLIRVYIDADGDSNWDYFMTPEAREKFETSYTGDAAFTVGPDDFTNVFF